MYIYINIYIYIYIYEQESNVCMRCAVKIKQKTQSLFDQFLYFFLVMSVNGEIQNAYKLYINKNTFTVAPSGNFTKETNNF